MSESSTAATKRKEESGDVMMKKKLKVLKQALKEERELKVKAEKDLAKANDEIEALKNQVAEKDKRVKDLYQEKMNLEDSLLKDMYTKQKTTAKDETSKGIDKSDTKKKLTPLSTLASPPPAS